MKFTGKLLKNRRSWKPPKLTESEWEVRGQYNVPFYKLPTQLLCTLHHKRLLLRTIYLWGHPLPRTTLYTELHSVKSTVFTHSGCSVYDRETKEDYMLTKQLVQRPPEEAVSETGSP